MKQRLSYSAHGIHPSQLATLFVAALLLAALPGAAGVQRSTIRGAQLSAPVTPVVFDGDIRDLPPHPAWKPGDPIKQVPKRYYPRDGAPVPAPPPPGAVPDQLWELQRSSQLRTSSRLAEPILSLPGINYTGVFPPDTVGDVGPNYYIQSVNGGGGSVVQIFDKNGIEVGAVFDMDSLWTAGGGCTQGAGDPIILYDEPAGRWLMSEFAFGNLLCVYLSQTGDPVSGGWYGYEFATPNFPDYPKYGVWHNAYLATSNEGGGSPVYALERAQMLVGAPATSQRFEVPDLSGFGFQGLTPADHDGATPPPAGAPGIVMRHRDDEAHGGNSSDDFLDIWAFDIDWAAPANSTLTQLPDIVVTDFDSALCGLSTLDCIPQPGTNQGLDPLREVIMWRLQYRNQGAYETLVGSLAVAVGDFSDHAGIRWFELRKIGAADWTLFQEGTWSPDATHRWMSSAAMDEAGDIGLGYSLSDAASVYPSIGYTGRTDGDAPGIMTEPETVVVNGDSSQGLNRWGDYSALNVDPADGCTFWVTNEYIVGGAWDTWIATFQLPACLCANPIEPPTNPTASVTVDNQIDLRWDDSLSASVSEYRIDRGTAPGGPYTPVTTVPDSSPGVGSGAPYVYNDTPVSGGTSYYYLIVADDGANCRAGSAEVDALATGPCFLAPSFSGLAEVTDPQDCTLDLRWDPGSSNCNGTVSYDVHRDTVSGFSPTPANRIATGLTGTTYNDNSPLSSDTTYYYIVRAVDNTLTEDNLVERSGSPGGPPGAMVSHTSTDTPIDIPDDDRDGIVSSILVPDTGALRYITVDVDIPHERIGNLRLALLSPSGTEVLLLNRPGRPPRQGCDNADMLVTFDDAGTVNLQNHCAGTTPWYDGVGRPLAPLALLLGEPIDGDWTLSVSDRAGSDVGRLVSWTLNLAPAGECNASACDASAINPIDQLQAVKSAADVNMTWRADPAANQYNVMWVDNKLAIPARLGNGTEVCVATVVPPTPCVDVGAVPPDGVLRYYNVIGACDGVEAAE